MGRQGAMAHRVFGPRPRQSKAAPKRRAEPNLRPLAETLASDFEQDPETAEKNAQNIAQVLRRALRRRKTNKTLVRK